MSLNFLISVLLKRSVGHGLLQQIIILFCENSKIITVNGWAGIIGLKQLRYFSTIIRTLSFYCVFLRLPLRQNFPILFRNPNTWRDPHPSQGYYSNHRGTQTPATRLHAKNRSNSLHWCCPYYCDIAQALVLPAPNKKNGLIIFLQLPLIR